MLCDRYAHMLIESDRVIKSNKFEIASINFIPRSIKLKSYYILLLLLLLLLSMHCETKYILKEQNLNNNIKLFISLIFKLTINVFTNLTYRITII